jgi:dCTP deaminase
MILSDRDIKSEIKKGNIVIKPTPNFKTQLSSCSIDLCLGDEFTIFQHAKLPFIDIKKPITNGLVKSVKIKDDEPFVLQPRDFVLATTYEWVKLPNNIAGRLEGRSSIGRLGVIIHSTAALIDPGFSGKIVLELGNIGRMPVILYKKIKICSLSFEKLTTQAEIPYYKKKVAKFLNQTKPDLATVNNDI